MQEVVCINCEHIGKPKLIKKGSLRLEIFLWVVLLIPGPFYTVWRILNKRKVCEKCESDMLTSLDSRVGQLIAQKYGEVFSEHIEEVKPEAEKQEEIKPLVHEEEVPEINQWELIQQEVKQKELEKRKTNQKNDDNLKEDW